MKNNRENTDTLGGVLINYNYYSGEDLYSEGVSEDILLDYVMRYPREEYDQIIQSTRSWSVLYHLSHTRENIVSFLPITKEQSVLEIGAGCGAVTGALSRMAGKVTCIELSKKRSLINANRHADSDNIEIIVGNFQDIEPEIEEKYDYITLIGVLEYAESYINSDRPYDEFISRIKRHLKPNGKLVIAIENKYGLKYFAGCREDHTGRFFEGIEGYSNTSGVKTFSKKGLEEVLNSNGLFGRFYYPYPDYKLCESIYSDEYLPKCGELNNNMRNFDADRVICFDETKAFNEIVKDGMFSEFSNSYLVVASSENIDEEYPIYAKYSDERRDEYKIVTLITNNRGERNVYKCDNSDTACTHVKSIGVHGKELEMIFEGTGFVANRCSAVSETNSFSPVINRVKLDYITGITFEEYLDSLEEQNKYDEMLALIRKFTFTMLKTCKNDFVPCDDFYEVFSDAFRGRDRAALVSDIDLIFTNIVLDRDMPEKSDFNVLDYEWTYSFPVPMRFIIYRSIFYYTRNRGKSGFSLYLKNRGINLYKESGISEEEANVIFPKMENHFQVYIKGRSVSLDILFGMMGASSVSFENAVKDSLSYGNLTCPEVYFGTGLGFKPEDQLVIIGKADDEHKITLEIPLSKEVTELRVDPADYPCMIKLDEAQIIEEEKVTEIDRFMVNGYVLSETSFLYDHNDPQIVFDKLPNVENKVVKLTYTVSKPDKSIYEDLKLLLAEKMEREDKERELTFSDKILIKLKRWMPEVVPEGYRFNKPLEDE